VALSDVLTGVAEYIGDVLVNDCGMPAPGRVLRYHGHAVPDEVQCDETGILSVWWEPFLEPRVATGSTPCLGYPVVTIAARWVRCWQPPEVDQDGVTLVDPTWDADAAELADAAECVARGLMALDCAPDRDDPFVAALLEVGRRYRFTGASPAGVGGGVAGVVWRLQLELVERESTS
jgi:hypothetical protein